MSRPSKFSLSGLNHGTSVENKNAQYTSQNGRVAQRDFSKMSKAERVLGPAEAIHHNSPSKWSRGFGGFSAKRLLQKKSTAMGEAVSGIISSFSGKSRKSHATTRSGAREGMASATTSTSTLQLQYGANKGPVLAVSQQTLAPRSYSIKSDVYRPNRTMEPPAQSRGSHPRPIATKDRPISSASTIQSMSSLSITSDPVNASSRTRWRGWRSGRLAGPVISETQPLYENQPFQPSRQIMADSFVPASQRPRANPTSQAELDQRLGPPKVHGDIRTVHENEDLTPGSSSSSVKTLTSSQSRKDAKAAQTRSQPPPQPKVTNLASGRTDAMRSNFGSPSRMTCNDLQIQSVLSLSSSEDESEPDTRPVIVIRPKQSHHTKNISVTSTTTAKPSQKRRSLKPGNTSEQSTPVAGRSRPVSTKKASVSFDPSITNTHGKEADLPQTTTTKRLPQEDKPSQPMYVTEDSKPPGKPKLLDTPPGSRGERRRSPPGRVMVVTQAEERLLEAMREKRATLRDAKPAASTETTTAFESTEVSPKRPRTADTDNRSSALLGSEMSSFPVPPKQRSDSIRSMNNPRASLSSAEVRLAEEIPYIERASILNALNGFLVPSKRSSRMNSMQSDNLPSPTTSRGSPRTPPSGHYMEGPTSPPDAYSAADATVRSEKRVTKNDVIFIDEGEVPSAKEQDEREEQELTQWAMETQTQMGLQRMK